MPLSCDMQRQPVCARVSGTEACGFLCLLNRTGADWQSTSLSGEAGMEKQFFVIGKPIAHSLSPLIHNQALRECGLEGNYAAREVNPEDLAVFFAEFRKAHHAGCNITLPHKVAALALVDGASERARRLGAINTLFWRGEQLLGENTDVIGFTAPLQGRHFAHALVLGAGGVSRAVICGLQELQVPAITIANRSPEKARALAEEFGIACCPWEEREAVGADLVINATSLGMKGEREALTPYTAFTGQGLAYDIVYTPEKTRFLAEAEAAGWQVQSGVAMFVEQARASFRLWTGMDMPADSAYAAVRAALAARNG